MENGTEKINRILANLSSTQEDMLALKDYIWLNLDHSSVEEVQTAASFLVKYLELLDQFAQNSQEISALISQFTGVQIEETPKEVEKNNSDNQRLIKELNKNKRVKLNANEKTLLIFDEYIQGFSILLMNNANVALRPIISLNDNGQITLDNMNSYLLNNFCKGLTLHEEGTQFNELLLITDNDCELQIINIR